MGNTNSKDRNSDKVNVLLLNTMFQVEDSLNMPIKTINITFWLPEALLAKSKYVEPFNQNGLFHYSDFIISSICYNIYIVPTYFQAVTVVEKRHD